MKMTKALETVTTQAINKFKRIEEIKKESGEIFDAAAVETRCPASLTVKVYNDKGLELASLHAEARYFSSGSMGYHANGQFAITDRDSVMLSCPITIKGSKPKR